MQIHTPPVLQSHQWNQLKPSDDQAYQALAFLCAQTDRTALPTPADHQEKFESSADVFANQTLGLFNDLGDLLASAWISLDDSMQHEYRAFLDILVHPELRDEALAIENHLLAWAETQTRSLAEGRTDQRPWILRLDFYHQNQVSIDRYLAAGFGFALAEDEMRRDLAQPIAANSLTEGVEYHTWTPELAPAFFEVYSQAFRERPGFPGWSEETWRRNMTGHDEFRPDLSLLVSDGHTPIGFALCAVEADQTEAGHIIQMGVVPTSRNNGIATALLSEIMRRFKATGLRYATLEVNANNPQALSVYQHNGFEQTKRYSSYRKTI